MKDQNIPKKGLAGLKAHFKDDLISGFSVSLIALPLCLGIAIASGVPPLAGLITAIVGGIIASRVSGTFVTISGPAAGLIVITLGAAESMGGAGIETGFAGYPHALGAILIGGLIMAVFGLLKVGKVGDYFPSAAVHGMLAAIGVIIMIKLLFPALGVDKPKGEILEVATEIPHAFKHLNLYAVIISVVALAILIVHPIIKSKIIKLIPAPMWVLLFTIPLAAYLGVENLSMVNLDGGLLNGGGLSLPSFEKIGTSAFWIAVVGVALVSAIESLLSAKAVDSLDPYKRKSNLDKDLISMGAGSSLAAALGGLPMISEIVRSSANVNNGAKTQWSNFFHGVFLLIYILIAVTIIEMIPEAALAAMLVFTGFKLAHPKEFVHMAKIGITEIIVFIITLIAVLATDLIIGIVIGIIVTYIFILVKGNPIGNLFKAKGDLYENTLHLKGFLTFSNFLSLKKKMDQVLEKDDTLTLNFAGVNYIDHTVAHHLEDYERNAKLAGKNVISLNLEGLNPETHHPLAAKNRKGNKLGKDKSISNRGEWMQVLAKRKGYRFQNKITTFNAWDFYSITTRKKVLSIEHILSKKVNNLTFVIADITTKKGAETATDIDTVTAIKISGVNYLPKFYMVEETVFDRLADKLIGDDINFDKFPVFSKNCVLKGIDQIQVRQFFTDQVIQFFEKNLSYYLVSNGNDLLLRKELGMLDEDGILELQNKATELMKIIA